MMADPDEDERGDDPTPPAEPEEPAPKPEPERKPIGLAEMADIIIDEAIRREQNCRARLKAFGTEPSEKELRQIEVLKATARFLDTLVPIMPTIRGALKNQFKKKN